MWFLFKTFLVWHLCLFSSVFILMILLLMFCHLQYFNFGYWKHHVFLSIFPKHCAHLSPCQCWCYARLDNDRACPVHNNDPIQVEITLVPLSWSTKEWETIISCTLLNCSTYLSHFVVATSANCNCSRVHT